MKTAISLPDETFARVEVAARRLGVSRSEFFARAAERWLDDLDDQQTTEAINRAIAGLSEDAAFTEAAAEALARHHDGFGAGHHLARDRRVAVQLQWRINRDCCGAGGWPDSWLAHPVDQWSTAD